MLLRPDGAPARKKEVPLSRAEVKQIMEFEEFCRRRGIALDLICTKCVDAGAGKLSRLAGNNNRYANVWKMECACTVHVHGRDPKTVPVEPGRLVTT